MALPTQPNGSTDVRLETPANGTTRQTENTLNLDGTTDVSKFLILNQK